MSTFNFNHQPLSLYIIVEWHFSSVLPLTPHLGLVFFLTDKSRFVYIWLHVYWFLVSLFLFTFQISCDRQNNDPPKYLILFLVNLLCYKGCKSCLSANFKIGRLSWIIWLGPMKSQGSFEVEEMSQRNSIRRTQLPLLALQMEEGAMSQAMQAASRR